MLRLKYEGRKGGGVYRQLLAYLTALILTLGPVGPFPGASGAEGQRRALLLGVDQFVSQPSTSPAALSNLSRLEWVLRQDAGGYARITTRHNLVLGAEDFIALVKEAFSGAQPGDLSFFYITTHGLYTEGEDPMSFSLLLSDGEKEYALTAGELYAALAPLPGHKLLIIDACNSGALIDRGMPGTGQRSLFLAGDFHVLTSAGGSEPSFVWETGTGSYRGGSYFADALLNGIAPWGRYGADQNRDGIITLKELHAYLLDHYGSSTPRVYPLNDNLPVLCYDQNRMAGQAPAIVTQVMLEQRVLTPAQRELAFSYTLHMPTRLAYQLVYHREEQWQFAEAQVFTGDLDDRIPGRKEKNLLLDGQQGDASGYVLLMIIAYDEDSATPQAEALLLVEPARGNPQLAVEVGTLTFAPRQGQEMPLMLRHAFPLRLTVHILDEANRVVATLLGDQPTRPEHLPGGGSQLYWDGRLQNGRPATPGRYRARVSAMLDGRRYTAISSAFFLE